MIDRKACERAFREALRHCEPQTLVHGRVVQLGEGFAIGLAIGKAALRMARGAGAVGRGLVVTNADDGQGVPSGWHVMIAAHPVPDERSLAAGEAAVDLLASASAQDRVLALISGGASALCERLAPGVTLDALRTEIASLAARGAPIHELNARRIALSAIKGGKLAQACDARITTLVISDVFDDDLAAVGSGPTIAGRAGDRVELIAAMKLFGRYVARASGFAPIDPPLVEDVAVEAERIAKSPGNRVYWGEPTVTIPADHGEGGRAQQLALELAKRLRGARRAAFVVGSDGIDGPPPPLWPAPAGAYVDGTTWEDMLQRGLDPQRALDRRDAGTVLAAVGALVVTGPTGINHADVAIVG